MPLYFYGFYEVMKMNFKNSISLLFERLRGIATEKQGDEKTKIVILVNGKEV